MRKRVTVRYSKAFKIHLVREVEKGEIPLSQIARKYGLGTCWTLCRWVRQLGNGTSGKVIYVKKPEELDELTQLRREIKRVKEALANAHMDLALEKAFTELLAEKAGIDDLEGFKKKQGGQRSTKR
jgi:transposase-like protein